MPQDSAMVEGDVRLICTIDQIGDPIFKSENIADVCQEHESGAEWNDELFKYKCIMNKLEILGCYTDGGDYIPKNETKLFYGESNECKVNAKGVVTLDTKILPKCKDSKGNERDGGSVWDEGVLRYKCGSKGNTEFVGCNTPSGEHVPNGGVLPVAGFDLECKENEDGSISMRAIATSK
ncbi:hypothetical protein KIN20_031313 [Parelaphostrongylus tenuis]|uniref:Abnormal cell migration protein 18-like fibronectin type I domain-containing protein n=1 Tax=Parelaphostrongylus tenuis TaxID=148309 RepID=A0AAD5R4Z2_PARTN|nr:hypothetical protein KIN20_031313 [Parelaphostrongylus tenuis]